MEVTVIRRVVMVGWLLQAAVVPAAAQDYAKGWVDVNFGTATAAEDEFTSARTFPVSQEIGAGAVAYGLPRGASFDVSGGYMFSARLGLGVSLAGTAHEDTAGLAISVPHPLYFDSSAEDATVTDGTFMRTEGAWHIHAMFVPFETPRVRIRVFGGPSYVRIEQDTVSSIIYDQTFQVFGRLNSVEITSYRSEKSEGTGWGLHAGADLSAFFNRVVGLGAVIRVSRATVEIDDYGGVHDVSAGGVQFSGGLRLRF